MRLFRILMSVALLAALALSIQAAPASAAALRCLDYDQGDLASGAPSGRACLYAGADYPNFKGTVFLGKNCGGDILPGDIALMIACLRAPTVTAWKWSASGWQQTELYVDTAYAYPFAAGWRWVWRAGSWYAVKASDVSIRWFCPSWTGGGCYSF